MKKIFVVVNKKFFCLMSSGTDRRRRVNTN